MVIAVPEPGSTHKWTVKSPVPKLKSEVAGIVTPLVPDIEQSNAALPSCLFAVVSADDPRAVATLPVPEESGKLCEPLVPLKCRIRTGAVT